MTPDRTGAKLERVDSLVITEVITKAKARNVYLLRDFIKDEPSMVSGGYFVTGEQLEEMIVDHETILPSNSL